MKNNRNSILSSGANLGGGISTKRTLGRTEKKILIVSGIALILTLIIGISYAYIMYTAKQKGINNLETDCINVEMEELTNAINLVGAYPVLDEVGERNKPFRFKLTNKCGVGVNYDFNLEVMETEEGTTRVPSHNVAAKVDEQEKKILNKDIKITDENYEYTGIEAYTLYQGELKPGASVTHELRLWLDKDADNSAQNGKFYSKVVIQSFQNQVSMSLSDFIINLSKEEGKDVTEFTHETTYQTESNAITDYRYTGKEVNNYICFKDSACSEDELYRIIGVIPTQNSVNGEYKNRVKVIKATPYEGISNLENSTNTKSEKGYRWNKTESNIWYTSILYNVLNDEYYQNATQIKEAIDLTKWYLGAPVYSSYKTYTAEQIYTEERSNNTARSGGNLYSVDYIGLMYPSDYGFSVLTEEVEDIYHKAIYTNSSQYINKSWLYQNGSEIVEWTITPEKSFHDTSVTAPRAWVKSGISAIDHKFVSNSESIYAIRPVFYLKTDVLYKSGTGAITDPYRINQ